MKRMRVESANGAVPCYFQDQAQTTAGVLDSFEGGHQLGMCLKVARSLCYGCPCPKIVTAPTHWAGELYTKNATSKLQTCHLILMPLKPV